MKFKTLTQLRKALKLIGYNFKKTSYSEFNAIELVKNDKEKTIVVRMSKTEPGLSSILLYAGNDKLKTFLDDNQQELILLSRNLYKEEGRKTVGLIYNEVNLSLS